MRAGVGRAVITPQIGIEHAGWGAQVHHRAEGVHLDLWVTVLVVEGETETFAILDYDLMVVTVEDSDRIREDVAGVLGIDPQNVRVSFTHTHAGPVWSDLASSRSGREGQELVPGYRETIWSQTLGATHQAKGALRPARLAAGWGESNIAVNRRLRAPTGELVVGQNFEGFADHRVLVVRFDDLDENPLAALVCYAAHPIILAYQNRLLSPDFPGVAKRVVEDLTGAACLYLQGCAGNIMTIEALTGDLGAAERMGTMLGAEAAKVFTGIRTRPTRRRFAGIVESGAPLGIWVDEPLPDRKPQIRVNAGHLGPGDADPSRIGHPLECERRRHPGRGGRIRIFPISPFDDLAQVHNRHSFAHMPDHRQIMGNEQIGQPQIIFQLDQQVDDLGLNRDIQRRDRFVQHQQLGAERQGPGDADPLPLSTGELVGVFLGVTGMETHQFQEFLYLVGIGAAAFVDDQGLGDDVPRFHAGIERSERVLEDDLHISANGTHLPSPQFGDIPSHKDHPSAGGSQQSHHQLGERGLPAPRFPDQPQGLALGDRKADPIHCSKVSATTHHPFHPDGVVHDDILHLHQSLGNAIRHPF